MRPPRFRLRTLLVAVAVAALLLAVWRMVVWLWIEGNTDYGLTG